MFTERRRAVHYSLIFLEYFSLIITEIIALDKLRGAIKTKRCMHVLGFIDCS